MAGTNQFWRWFQGVERKYRDLEVPHKDALLDEFQKHLQAYCGGLWFEIGGSPEGPRELVITAEEKREYFQYVTELVVTAPKLNGWDIVSFKPAHGFDFVTEYESVSIDPHQSWFIPLDFPKNPNALGLKIAVPSFDPSRHNEFLSATRIVLETGLGELEMAEQIHHVEVGPIPNDPEAGGYIELNELPEYIAWRKKKCKFPIVRDS